MLRAVSAAPEPPHPEPADAGPAPSGVPTYAELLELEPRLGELEAALRSERDDGASSFYCSNFAWLPYNAELKRLVGVARVGSGEAQEPVLYDSGSYEVAYEHLSKLLPPCRDCGCRAFAPYLGIS